MKVKIIKCSNPSWWYVDKIGREIEVEKRYYLIPEDEEKDSFLVKGGIGVIQKSDCQVIEDSQNR